MVSDAGKNFQHHILTILSADSLHDSAVHIHASALSAIDVQGHGACRDIYLHHPLAVAADTYIQGIPRKEAVPPEQPREANGAILHINRLLPLGILYHAGIPCATHHIHRNHRGAHGADSVRAVQSRHKNLPPHGSHRRTDGRCDGILAADTVQCAMVDNSPDSPCRTRRHSAYDAANTHADKHMPGIYRRLRDNTDRHIRGVENTDKKTKVTKGGSNYGITQTYAIGASWGK